MRTVLETLASTYVPTDPPSVSFVSIDAESLPDISESYNVTAVPFLVLQRDNKTLETVSGSDAVKVRSAIERHYTSPDAQSKKVSLPPKLEVTERFDQKHDLPTAKGSVYHPAAAAMPNGSSANNDDSTASTTKNLSSYAPTSSDPPTAPAMSGAAELPSADPNPVPDTTDTKEDQLNSRLANLVKAAPVMLFMKGTPSAPQCGFSRQLVGILRERSVRYGFFNILADEDVRQGLKVFADWPTYPQLWVGGELVGGLDIVSC